MTKEEKRHKAVVSEMKKALKHSSSQRIITAYKTSQTPTRLTHRREHLWLGRAMEGAPI